MDTISVSINIILMLMIEKSNSSLSLFGRPAISIFQPAHIRQDPKAIKHAAEVANAATKVYF